MKKTLITLTLFVVAATAAFAELKVATVDMAKLFDGYSRAKTVEAAMDAKIQKVSAEAQRRQNEGRAMVGQLEDLAQKYNNPALSQVARDAAKKQARDLEDRIEMKKNEFEKYRTDTSNALMKEQSDQRLQVYTEIQRVAAAVAHKQGASLVLNISEKTAAGLPVVVYSEKNWDITNAVLATLNAGAPKPAAK